MRKTLRLFLFTMLAMLTSTAYAQTVFDFDANGSTLLGLAGESSNDSHDGDITETKTATIDGFTITISAAGEGKTTNRIWNAAPKLRIYDGTLTITSSSANIKKIDFTLASQASKAKWGATNSADSGTINAEAKTSATWTGDAKEVVFTIGGNTQISQITISTEDGGTPVTPPTPQVEQVTVAEALAIIDALADGAKTEQEYQVKGYVVELTDISTQFGNATFTMADAKGGSPVLTYFRGKGLNGAEVNDAEFLAVDDEVVVQGLLYKYVKNEVVTPEVSQGGKIVSINGKTEDDTPVTVEKAANIAAFKALADGTVAELTLSNAVVTYVNDYNGTKEVFVRDASGALDLYNLGIDAEAGKVLNGTITGVRGVNGGFIYAMKSTSNTDASKVSVSGAAGDVDAVEMSFDEAADHYCNYVVLKGVTLDENKKNAVNEDSETLPLYDRFKLSLLSDLLTDGTKYDIYGLMYDGGSSYGAELVLTKVTLAGGGVIEDTPATSVPSIAALLGMENTPNVELTLNNAKVLFVDGNNYVYVRENGKALCFYQISGLKDQVKNNSIINGKIQVDYEVYKLLPEVKSNKNTNLDELAFEESEEKAEPVATTLAQVAAGENVCDLVTVTATLIREVTYKEDGETVNTTTYYLQDGDTKIVAVNNGKGLNKLADNAVEQVTVTGIVNTSNNAYQIKLTETAVDPSGINDVRMDTTNQTVFNLAGQRVEKAQKGLYIIGGKKVVKK